MFRNFRTFALVLLAAAPILAACDVDEGPAEQLGEKLDRAADRVGDRVEDATRR